MTSKLNLPRFTNSAARLFSRFRRQNPELRIETLDFSASEVAANPFLVYKKLRARSPVHFLPKHDAWIVLGYDEVQLALAQPRLFSNRTPEWQAVDRVLLGMDPPAHSAARRALAPQFSPSALQAQPAFAESAAKQLLQPLLSGARCNVLLDFAAPLAEEVAAHLIGLDEAALHAARMAQRTATDTGDWLDALDAIIRGEAARLPVYNQLLCNEEQLTEAEARSLVRLMWVAGITTTRRAIASSVLMLLRNPLLRADLVDNPARLSAFVEECIRLHPPEHMLARVATADVELGGAKIPAGSNVKLCVAAANRDPSQFREPDSLLMDRSPNPHLSFGSGIHRCLGAGLAHMEAISALRVLLQLAPHFRAVYPIDALPFVGFANDTEELLIEC